MSCLKTCNRALQAPGPCFKRRPIVFQAGLALVSLLNVTSSWSSASVQGRRWWLTTDLGGTTGFTAGAEAKSAFAKTGTGLVSAGGGLGRGEAGELGLGDDRSRFVVVWAMLFVTVSIASFTSVGDWSWSVLLIFLAPRAVGNEAYFSRLTAKFSSVLSKFNATCWPRWPENKVGQRTQKQDGTQHASFWKSCGVGSCALREIDVRSLLKHRAHWWHQGPQSTTACCASYIYILLVAISARFNYILNLSHLSSRYLFLGSRLVCFAAEGARTKSGRTEHRARWKLNDGGSWSKEHESEDMKMTNGEWS